MKDPKNLPEGPSRALTPVGSDVGHVPALIAAAGEDAARHFLNFFIASIRNRNTRRSYARRVEAIVEAFVDMQKDLQAERRTAERQWSKREKQIQRVIANTAGMHGDLQGIIGTALQTIPALTAGEEEDTEEVPAL